MFQYAKELLPSFKKEVERFIERLEVGQLYGAGFFNAVGKPAGGDKALVLENKEMGLQDVGEMDVEVYGAMGQIEVISPKGRECCSPW